MSLLCWKHCVSCLLYSSQFFFSFFLFLAFVSCHPSSHIYCLRGFHGAPAANSFVYQAFNIYARLFISPLCFHPRLWICATEDILPQLLLVIRRCPPSPPWPLWDASGSQSKQAQKGLMLHAQRWFVLSVSFFLSMSQCKYSETICSNICSKGMFPYQMLFP